MSCDHMITIMNTNGARTEEDLVENHNKSSQGLHAKDASIFYPWSNRKWIWNVTFHLPRGAQVFRAIDIARNMFCILFVFLLRIWVLFVESIAHGIIWNAVPERAKSKLIKMWVMIPVRADVSDGGGFHDGFPDGAGRPHAGVGGERMNIRFTFYTMYLTQSWLL